MALRLGVRAPSPPTLPQRPPPPYGPRRGERRANPLVAGARRRELPRPDSSPLPTATEKRGARPRAPPAQPQKQGQRLGGGGRSGDCRGRALTGRPSRAAGPAPARRLAEAAINRRTLTPASLPRPGSHVRLSSK